MKPVRKLCCLLCLLTACFLLCGSSVPEEGWSRREAYDHNEEQTRLMLDALMEGDQQAVLAIMGLEGEREFYNAYRHITKNIKGNVGYDLEILQNHSYTEEGFLIHRSNYRVAFSDRRVYGLIVHSVQGVEGLASFQVTYLEDEVAENRAPGWAVTGLLVLTLLGCAFGVWMIVDCARRPMKTWQKVLWIIAILVFAGPCVEWSSQSFFVMLYVRLPLGVSSAELVGGLWSLRIFLPVGALIYFFLRKRISAKYLAARKAYYDQKAPLDFTLDDQ